MEAYEQNLMVFLFLLKIGVGFFLVVLFIGYYKEIYNFLIRTSTKPRKSRKSNRNTFKV